MKKTTYVLALVFWVFCYTSVHSQVGIGTTNPKSRLDIPASNSSAPAFNDGLLIPRINNFPSTDPGLDQDGMLVFLTTNSGTYTKGFHYWDNTSSKWIAYNSEWNDGTNGDDGLIYGKQANVNGIDLTVLDNGRIGMGTDDPEESLELKLVGDNDIQIASASPPDTPHLVFYTTNGTFSAPAFMNNNESIGYVTGKVWTGSGKSSDAANIQMKADGNHSSGNLPTKIEFNVTAPNSTNIHEHDPEMVIRSSGNVGIGLNNPTATLQFKAGTATANSAPLKFTAGSNLTTPEAGSVEYDGTNLYFTPNTSRKILLKGLTTTSSLNFPNIPANSTSELTVTVAGATLGSTCNCAPTATIEAGLQWSCYVVASNSVRVRVSNVNTIAVNPASKNWKVTVIE